MVLGIPLFRYQQVIRYKHLFERFRYSSALTNALMLSLATQLSYHSSRSLRIPRKFVHSDRVCELLCLFDIGPVLRHPVQPHRAPHQFIVVSIPRLVEVIDAGIWDCFVVIASAHREGKTDYIVAKWKLHNTVHPFLGQTWVLSTPNYITHCLKNGLFSSNRGSQSTEWAHKFGHRSCYSWRNQYIFLSVRRSFEYIK